MSLDADALTTDWHACKVDARLCAYLGVSFWGACCGSGALLGRAPPLLAGLALGARRRRGSRSALTAGALVGHGPHLLDQELRPHVRLVEQALQLAHAALVQRPALLAALQRRLRNSALRSLHSLLQRSAHQHNHPHPQASTPLQQFP